MNELSHIETIEKELQQIESSNAWNQVYQKVRSDGTYNFPLTEARTPTNRLLNRYRDVLPYDHSRILLQHPTTDYINASLVKVESIKRQYILTQGPLSTTSQHFWLMVWQQQCKGIVMLNKIIEKNMVKCDQYWPLGVKSGGQDTMRFEAVGLSVELVSEAKHHHYIYRTLRLTETSTGNSREVQHFHFTTWPDFGVPQSPEAFSKFLSVVIKSGCLDPSVGPPIVHCSAGIGRSGTFCLVDTLLVMLERGLCNSNVGTVLEVLLDMRRYRMGLIQTPDQLRFSYQAIVHGARQRLQRQQRLTNGSLSNGNAVAGDSDSSSEEEEGGPLEEDVPPPRPPPRTDSLTRSMIDAQLLLEDQLQPDDDDGDSDEDDTDENSDQDGDQAPVESINVSHNSMPDRSLPAEPPSPDEAPPPPRPCPAVPTPPESNGHGGGLDSLSSPEMLAARMASEVRRRRQRERTAAISSKVSGIKERQEAAEEWQRRKRGSDEGAAAGGGGEGQGPSKRTKH